MLYSGTMSRILIIAVVACVILFVLAILIAPTATLEPSALRAQQWLSLIAAMFSLAGFFGICFEMVLTMIGLPARICEPPHRLSSSDLSCCLLC